GWGKQHGTMRKAKASRGCSYHRRILAEPHRLQPDPHPEIGCRIGELRKETRKSLFMPSQTTEPPAQSSIRNGESSNFPVFPQTARALRRDRRDQLTSLRQPDGEPVPQMARARIERLLDRLELVLKLIDEVEATRDTVLKKGTQGG